jgi:hypothetical protein
MSKVRPAGQIRPAKVFNPARRRSIHVDSICNLLHLCFYNIMIKSFNTKFLFFSIILALLYNSLNLVAPHYKSLPTTALEIYKRDIMYVVK